MLECFSNCQGLANFGTPCVWVIDRRVQKEFCSWCYGCWTDIAPNSSFHAASFRWQSATSLSRMHLFIFMFSSSSCHPCSDSVVKVYAFNSVHLWVCAVTVALFCIVCKIVCEGQNLKAEASTFDAEASTFETKDIGPEAKAFKHTATAQKLRFAVCLTAWQDR